jgi:hypothetical protein
VGHGFAEHAQGVLALQVVHGGDEAREVSPGVGVEAALAAQSLDERAVDDGEIEPELLQHFVAPLDLQGRRANHQDAVGAVAEHQLQEDHAGLDRLAETHVVRDEQQETGWRVQGIGPSGSPAGRRLGSVIVGVDAGVVGWRGRCESSQAS